MKRDIVYGTKGEKPGYGQFHANDSAKITKMILNNIPNHLDVIQNKIFNKKKYSALGGV